MFEKQRAFYDGSTPQKVVAKALIDADMVIEHHLGEAMADADDVLDGIRLQGWRLSKEGDTDALRESDPPEIEQLREPRAEEGDTDAPGVGSGDG